GGLLGAKAICNARAAAGGLGGDYVAWLSSSTVDAKDQLTGSGGWGRPDGKAFTNTLAELLAGEGFFPHTLPQSGNAPSNNNRFNYNPITNTNENGLKYSTSAGSNCNDWTSTNSNGGDAGAYGGGTRDWTDRYGTGCNNAAPLICFGLGMNVTVA